MSFEQELRVARVRPSAVRLFWPVLFLAADAAVITFFLPRIPLGWATDTSMVTAGVIAILLWLVPALRFFGSGIEITTSRISIRGGLFGKARESVALEDVTGVERSRGRLTLQLRGLVPELELPRVAGAKAVAAEIEALIARK